MDAGRGLPAALGRLAGQRAHGRLRSPSARAAMDALAAALPRLLEQATRRRARRDGAGTRLVGRSRLGGGERRTAIRLVDLLLTPLLLYALLACVWTVGFEASSWQATPGKRALGLSVVDRDGRRLRSGGALLRFLAAGLSWLSLNIGHALAAFPPYLALHDHASGTRVLAAREGTRLPAWAWAWLALLGLAFAVAVGWGFLWLQATMQAAMQRALGG
jgi:hypothetical protein